MNLTIREPKNIHEIRAGLIVKAICFCSIGAELEDEASILIHNNFTENDAEMHLVAYLDKSIAGYSRIRFLNHNGYKLAIADRLGVLPMYRKSRTLPIKRICQMVIDKATERNCDALVGFPSVDMAKIWKRAGGIVTEKPVAHSPKLNYGLHWGVYPIAKDLRLKDINFRDFVPDFARKHILQ